MFFKLILESGHVGAGKSYEVVRYLEGKDIFSVLYSASRFPRVKKKGSRKGIKLIQEITRWEYLRGRQRERQDPYLNTHKKTKRNSQNVITPFPLGDLKESRELVSYNW
jgi:hypothetical protein